MIVEDDGWSSEWSSGLSSGFELDSSLTSRAVPPTDRDAARRAEQEMDGVAGLR